MRVALVTGAAGGIGSATIARLVADGCAVVADVRDRATQVDAVAVASAAAHRGMFGLAAYTSPGTASSGS